MDHRLLKGGRNIIKGQILEEVGFGRESSNLLKGILRGQSLGPIIGSDLLAPRFLHQNRPDFSFPHFRILKPLLMHRKKVIQNHTSTLPSAEQLNYVDLKLVNMLSVENMFFERRMLAEEVQHGGEIGELDFVLF